MPKDKPDWEYINRDRLTRWQSVALTSHGVITPANIISILGLVLVAVGSIYIYHSNISMGLILILTGRAMDLIDGLVAEYTKTKSPFGEIVDTSCDKLGIVILIVTAYTLDLFTAPLLVTLVLHHGFTALFSVLFARRYNIHTTPIGKYAMFGSWAIIIFALYATAYESSLLHILVNVCTAAYITVALAACASYYLELQRKIVKRMRAATWTTKISAIVFVENKKASNYGRSKRWIQKIQKQITGPPRVDIAIGDAEKSLVKYIKEQTSNNKKVLVAVAGGDGTVSAVANILLATQDQAFLKSIYFLPLWGGNANDVATMLNGLSAQNTQHYLLARSSIVPIPTIEVRLKHGKRERVIYACGYASFGATAYAARQINDERLADKSIVRFFPPLFLVRELLAVFKALFNAPLFTAQHEGKETQHYEHTFINGSRIAKVNRVPISLSEPAFFHAAVDKKHPSYFIELLRILFKRSHKEYVKRDTIALTVTEPVDAQIDGEVYRIKANTRVEVRTSSEFLYCVSTKLD